MLHPVLFPEMDSDRGLCAFGENPLSCPHNVLHFAKNCEFERPL